MPPDSPHIWQTEPPHLQTMTEVTPERAHELAERLANLGRAVRSHVASGLDPATASRAVGVQGGDTIFAIDKRVEPLIAAHFDSWPEIDKPFLLVEEGLGTDGHRQFGAARPCRWRLLIDPIDGTRGIMYDKRSAWFLAAIAPDRGESTSLSDCIAAAMVELPTSKQAWGDVFTATAGGRVHAYRERLGSTERVRFAARPSQEASLRYGFGHVADFFPGTRLLAADLMETITAATTGSIRAGDAAIFNDQWISTGGQMVELMVGHDRFCCDLRPLFFDILERKAGRAIARGLECHPYDISGMLVARQAGVVLTDGWGNPLDAPFSVDRPVHWCGYANEHLRTAIEPVILRWLRKHLSA